MAKRKAARATGRKRAGTRAGLSRTRSRAAGAARTRKSAARKGKSAAGKIKSAARTNRGAARKNKNVAGKRKGAARQKGATSRSAARRDTARKGAARKVARKAAVRKTPRRPAGKAATRKSPTRRARSVRSGGRPLVTLASVRRAPALDRERRILTDDDDNLFSSTRSSLDLDRTTSSVRTGRHELEERLHDHTESSPALTAGDVDADWAGAYATGDEAPGGDNPTPDQDIVDEIGKALGVQYEDDEELTGEAKISARDKKRWEMDPASSDDYKER